MAHTTDTPTYRALDLLVKGNAPKINHKKPFWNAAPAPVADQVHTPTWDWANLSMTVNGAQLVDLDVNAAYLAAASSGSFAHGALKRVTADDMWASPGKPLPGYYQIEVQHWGVPGICSPLGTVDLPRRTWVTEPTLTLLLQLSDAGYWPGVTVYDAYVCSDTFRMTYWTNRIRDDRASALRSRALLRNLVHGDTNLADASATLAETYDDALAEAEAWYEEIKRGYSIAVQFMNGHEKSEVTRPDWYATIHAQHAATTWRKVWNCHLRGYSPAAMGAVDEVTYPATALNALLHLTPSPLRLDNTGTTLGSWKIKEQYTVGQDVTA